MLQKPDTNSVQGQLGLASQEEVRDIVCGKVKIPAERFNYTADKLTTNTGFLTEDQKSLIAQSLNQKWVVPEFKVKNFIGNAQITPYAKIKQYLLELNTREAAVENMEYEVQKIFFEIEVQEELKAETESPAQKKLHDLEIVKLQRLQHKSIIRLRDAYVERDMYLKLIEEFNSTPEAYLEDGRRIMDLINDPVEAEKLEKHYWTLRLAKQTALDMIAYGRAGVGNMEAVSMLETDQQYEVMQIACDYFVRNEMRTNSLLSNINENIQKLGSSAPVTELSRQLYLTQEGTQNVSTIQISK